MKKNIIVTTLVLAMALTLPVWADEVQHTESSTQPAIEMAQEKLHSSTMGMKESRMKMETATSPSERQVLMHEHMQQMKDGIMMMEMMDSKGMMSAQGNKRMGMMEGKTQMMMEMMRGMMGQQEMMMKK